MPESDDIKVHDPTSREKEKQPYEEGDVAAAVQAGNFRDWDQLIRWLREKGDDVRRLTPGEVRSMVEDFTRLKERGAPFKNDPHELYEMAHAK